MFTEPTSYIYLASPYSDPDPTVMEARFHRVSALTAKLLREGAAVFSPVAYTHPLVAAGQLPVTWEFWKAYDTVMLRNATKVVVVKMDGWKTSRGVAAEVELATKLGKPVSYIDEAPEPNQSE